MIIVTIVIEQKGSIVHSKCTSENHAPTLPELVTLTDFHKVLTEGAARQAVEDKATLSIVDTSKHMPRTG